MSITDYGLRAEIRAVTEGHRAFVQDDGSIRVKSESDPSKSYRVEFRTVAGYVRFDCDCPAGSYRRRLPVPCKHAALAGRRLEREGLARWDAGEWLSLVRPEPQEDVFDRLDRSYRAEERSARWSAA